jgi:Domain of unknown function (DUF397)
LLSRAGRADGPEWTVVVAVRDSKNPNGAMLTFPPAAFAGFVTVAKSGRLDVRG